MSPYWMDARSNSAFLFAFLIISSFPSTFAGLSDPCPNFANLSTSWTNTRGEWVNSSDWALVKPILLSLGETSGPGFLCGFHCHYESFLCLFAILIFQDVYSPQLVWSANRNRPVRFNATLRLTEDGNLILADADGTFVWSTNTAGKSVSGLNLTETGNLVLLDRNNEMVWQSFDHPTDSLVLQQKLVPGRSSSPAYLHQIGLMGIKYTEGLEEFNFTLFAPIPRTLSAAQYMRLGSDGHLRVYQWQETEWQVAVDLTDEFLTGCQDPLACGKYGICSAGQCTCPGASDNGTIYFRPINERKTNLGCSAITPISCQLSQYHSLLELQNTSYFTFQVDIQSTDVEICKQTCLKNCSCKAALFRHPSNHSSGDCCLLSDVFTLQNMETLNPTDYFTEKKTGNDRIIVGSSLGALFGVLILIGAFIFLFWKRRDSKEAEEDHLDCIPGMPTRFSFEDLKAITENFSCKLGEGGFGSVFQGTLSNGIKVAVKNLEGLGQVKKSFLAEVETIGSVHMSICQGTVLSPRGLQAENISLGYQPQNILLDEDFNAKVSDFGLSKLIDKDQSQVVTRMRGTPGYLAPEWLTSIITEKVDVYSFGVVVLEILCGRKNLDRSQTEEDMHLLGIFKRKAEENRLADIIDKCSEDMQLHGADVVEMMKVGGWCLQSDFARRPSMSVVVKVFGRLVDIEDNLEYSFSYSPHHQKLQAWGTRLLMLLLQNQYHLLYQDQGEER
ncbi:G-type lectin S-receptor-like serine/threonine-protein kinase SD2-5 [Vitis vinifera]|uniref:Receptor-like serine/threonine-protein kinase n=1 Tax=Vitis vinifera TaxID=29760 RepID=A0A438CYC5_VITVI|nr:G-type lectin S-receptor-like serine/threonine-protein kinase SD2-5 [Vitis vinifera]